MCVIRRHFRWVRADSRGNIFFAKYGGPSGGSQQSGVNVFFAKYGGPLGGSQQSGANGFFAIYWWASGGSLLSGGRIIIFCIIRRHFLAAAVDPAVSLSMYSILPMEFGH